jgi:hypothetical protein
VSEYLTALPQPSLYPDWQTWGSSIISQLEGILLRTEAVAPPAGFVSGTVTLRDYLGRPIVTNEGFYIYASSGTAIVSLGVVQINTEQLVDAAIETSKIANRAITSELIGTAQIVDLHILSLKGSKIEAGTIDTEQLVDFSIEPSKIADGAVVAGKIAAGAIVAGDGVIANRAITSELIGTAQIVNSHILSLRGNKIEAGTITSNELTASIITANYLEANAVTAGKIAAGAIVAGDGVIANRAITSELIGTAQVMDSHILNLRGYKIEAGTITTEKLTVSIITANYLDANAVTAGKIAAGTITTEKLTVSIITANYLDANAVTAGKIAAGAIVAYDGVIANAAITSALIGTAQILDTHVLSLKGNKIEAGTITAEKLTVSIITANYLDANAVIAGKLAAHSVVAGNIAADAVSTSCIAARAVTADKISVSALAAVSVYTGNLDVSTTGSIKGGQTSYNTGIGFFLGYSGGAYKFSIGNPSGNYLTWDGSTLAVKVGSGSSIDYAYVSGTKPPPDADKTSDSIGAGVVIASGGITLSGGGAVKGGQTDYNTGTGFFLGYSGGAYKFSIGNPSGNRVTWDGSSLTVVGAGIDVSTTGNVRGGQTDYATGTGFFLGYSGGAHKFSVGNSTNYIKFDGTTLYVGGKINVIHSAGDILHTLVDNTEHYTGSGHNTYSPISNKAIIAFSGSVRVMFRAKYIRSGNISGIVRVYKNGAQVGSNFYVTSSYAYYELDVSVSGGDELQIYGFYYNNGSGTWTYTCCNYFAIKVAEESDNVFIELL